MLPVRSKKHTPVGSRSKLSLMALKPRCLILSTAPASYPCAHKPQAVLLLNRHIRRSQKGQLGSTLHRQIHLAVGHGNKQGIQPAHRRFRHGLQKVKQPRHLCRAHRPGRVVDHAAFRAANVYHPHRLVYGQPKLLLRQKLIFLAEKVQVGAALNVSAQQQDPFQCALYFLGCGPLALPQQLPDSGDLISVPCLHLVVNTVFFPSAQAAFSV